MDLQKKLDDCEKAISSSGLDKSYWSESFDLIRAIYLDLYEVHHSEEFTGRIVNNISERVENSLIEKNMNYRDNPRLKIYEGRLSFVHTHLIELVSEEVFGYAFNALIKISNKYYNTQFKIKDVSKIPVLLETEKIDRLFNFDDVQKKLESLPDYKSKFVFLIEIRTKYLQYISGLNFDVISPFDKQCALEIEKIRTLSEFNLMQTAPSKKVFQLSKKSCAKIDLIRILYAFCELKFFESPDGTYATKENIMQKFGEFLGEDLSSYHTNLSQATKEQSLEANLKIYDDMKNAMQKHYCKKNP